MRALGLDVRGDGPAGVLVDDAGRVVARATAADGADRVGCAVRDLFDEAVTAAARRAAASSGVAATPRIVNRGGAVALAEQWTGAARGARHVVALTLDECVHAGIAVDGRLVEGAHGMAGAAAWLALNPVEREDYRRLGCLEAEIGTAGIVRRLVWRIKAGDSSRVVEAAGGSLDAITAAHIFAGARAGDGVAISVVRDTARYVGMAVANLVVVIDPDVVVLGGAIAEAADLLVEPARTEAMRRLPPALTRAVTIVPAALGADGAAIGAARAAMGG